MGQKEQLKLFDDKKVRVVWDDEQQEWYFSVVDVVEVLTDSANPTDYLKKMRKRDPQLNGYIGTNCPEIDTVARLLNGLRSSLLTKIKESNCKP